MFLSALLCGGMLSRAKTTVKSAEELKNVTVSGTSADGIIELGADLTFLNDIPFPLGMLSQNNCTPFTGVLHGNGYSIRCQGMPSGNTNTYNGLFCGLENATIDNLFIDSSCSLTGQYVGALCATVTGSITLSNVTNMANINGEMKAGGFIGQVLRVKEPFSISLNQCRNGGQVTAGDGTGGFIGRIANSDNMEIAFSECTNNETISGSSYVGGFIGDFSINKNVTLSFVNSTNSGDVSIKGDLGDL